MPLSQPVTTSEQATAIRDKIKEWADPRGGRCSIMQNQRHLWEELVDLPSAANLSPRVMVLCAGESLMLPDQPDCHRVDRMWQVIVIRGHGFKDPMSGGVFQPFYDSVETIRDIVRTMIGISDYEGVPSVQYKGTKPLPSVLPTKEAGAFMDGVVIEFNTLNDIPMVVEDAPGTEDTDGSELPP